MHWGISSAINTKTAHTTVRIMAVEFTELKAKMGKSEAELKWMQTKEGLTITIPKKIPQQSVIGFKLSGQ